MANYVCYTRTNYFHVKDADGFREMMSHVQGTEDSIALWEEQDEEGNPVFGFGTCGGIAGLFMDNNGDNDDDEANYDDFIDALQKYVADGDAIIILEAGHEKLRYVIGAAEIITSKDFKRLDITRLACAEAADMLDKAGWTTRCDY